MKLTRVASEDKQWSVPNTQESSSHCAHTAACAHIPADNPPKSSEESLRSDEVPNDSEVLSDNEDRSDTREVSYDVMESYGSYISSATGCIEYHKILALRPTDQSVQIQLQQWALKYQVSHTSLNSLLSVLKQNYNGSLPTDARTLLSTPVNQSLQIKNTCGGQYYQFGLLKAINKFLSIHFSLRYPHFFLWALGYQRFFLRGNK